MVSLAPNTVVALPPSNILLLFNATPPSMNVSCAIVRCAVVPRGICKAALLVMLRLPAILNCKSSKVVPIVFVFAISQFNNC